jgi:alpha-beta hydrolase superfamily lysophospholipase
MLHKISRRILFVVLACGGAFFLSTAALRAEPKHFVLVHGAWHTGASWNGVIEGLRKRGYSSEAITLPGYGPGNGDPSTATLADDAAALVAPLGGKPEPLSR